MIAKYDRIFRDNIISYIYNRIQFEKKDAVIAEEVMSRFPVWIKLYRCSNDMQKSFIQFLVYGIRQSYRLSRNDSLPSNEANNNGLLSVIEDKSLE